MNDPVVVEVAVKREPQMAFDLFARRIADWWPLTTHSLGASRSVNPAKTVILEPHAGGRIYEIAEDGSEEAWGTVTDWQPGEFIAFTWHVGRAPDLATRVSVHFRRGDAGGTLMTLTHDNWQALGDEASGVRAQYATGWHAMLNDIFIPFATAA